MKVPVGLEPQVWPLESANRFKFTSLAFRKGQLAGSHKPGLKKGSIGLEPKV